MVLTQISMSGYLMTLQFLHAMGVKMHIEDDNGFTPLIASAKEGQVHVVEWLLTLGVEMDKNITKALVEAIQNDHKHIVKLLLNATQDGLTPLLYAIEKGNERVVELLLKKGADPNNASKNGFTPLLYAIEKGNERIVELLLNAGADPNNVSKNGFTPLLMAIMRDNLRMVALLLKAGADADKPTSPLTMEILEETTPLLMAIISDNLRMVALLLNEGADVNKPTNMLTGATPLTMAITAGKVRMVALLLNSGATPDKEDKYSNTPLSVAIMKSNEPIVTLLRNAKGARATERCTEYCTERCTEHCTICMEVPCAHDQTVSCKRCRHKLHFACWQECIIQGFTTCPVCREPFT